MWGEGAHLLQCKSESAQCLEKQQSPCKGEGGLKVEEKMLEKQSSPHLRKKLGIGSLVFCTFSFTSIT